LLRRIVHPRVSPGLIDNIEVITGCPATAESCDPIGRFIHL
jgi:hypothetical protein